MNSLCGLCVQLSPMIIRAYIISPFLGKLAGVHGGKSLIMHHVKAFINTNIVEHWTSVVGKVPAWLQADETTLGLIRF